MTGEQQVEIAILIVVAPGGRAIVHRRKRGSKRVQDPGIIPIKLTDPPRTTEARQEEIEIAIFVIVSPSNGAIGNRWQPSRHGSKFTHTTGTGATDNKLPLVRGERRACDTFDSVGSNNDHCFADLQRLEGAEGVRLIGAVVTSAGQIHGAALAAHDLQRAVVDGGRVDIGVKAQPHETIRRCTHHADPRRCSLNDLEGDHHCRAGAVVGQADISGGKNLRRIGVNRTRFWGNITSDRDDPTLVDQ